jgi:hypothetical protein
MLEEPEDEEALFRMKKGYYDSGNFINGEMHGFNSDHNIPKPRDWSERKDK